jgi:hypothetical protein
LSSQLEHKEDAIQWRRNKVLELSSQGQNQRDIAQILRVSVGCVNRDLSHLRNQARINIKKYIDERLPDEYDKCLVGITSILREAWNTAANTVNEREKIQALSLAKECYTMKLELLTNATVVDDAIRFVEGKTRLILSGKDNEESKEPDYDDRDGLEQEHGKDTGETEESLTTNQIF